MKDNKEIELYRWAALIGKQKKQNIIDAINKTGNSFLLQYNHPYIEYDSNTLLHINQVYGMYFDCGEAYILTKDYRIIEIFIYDEPTFTTTQLKALTLYYYRVILALDTIKYELEEQFVINHKRKVK